MSTCLFCKIIQEEIPCHKIYEDDHVLAFLDIYPASRYHTLVIPKKHFCSLFDIDEDYASHLMRGVHKVVRLYNQKLGIEHCNILGNNGVIAQQEVPHLHVHIIPRYEGGQSKIVNRDTHPEMTKDFEDMIATLEV